MNALPDEVAREIVVTWINRANWLADHDRFSEALTALFDREGQHLTSVRCAVKIIVR